MIENVIENNYEGIVNAIPEGDLSSRSTVRVLIGKRSTDNGQSYVNNLIGVEKNVSN
jgi:hypothetical protein